MPDGRSHSEYRHKSLESGVMRKYHAPFGGRPTEKGSIQSTSPAAHPTLISNRGHPPLPERRPTPAPWCALVWTRDRGPLDGAAARGVADCPRAGLDDRHRLARLGDTERLP